jgi:hypothetical protein
VFYGEATIKPEGDQKGAVDALLGKFPGGDQAIDKLTQAIEKEARESGGTYTFKDDIEPWLGDRLAGFALQSGAAGEFEGAFMLATTDEEAARAGLEKSAEGKLTKKTYRGVEYMVDEAADIDTSVVLDGFAVGGTERAVKALIDAREDGATLAEDEAYEDALDEAAEDRLGFVYMNTPKLADAVRGTGAPLPESFQKFFDEPLVVTADADPDGVSFEANVPAELASASFVGKSSDLVGELPADSWLAMAQTDFGSLLDFYVEAFAGMVGGRDAVKQQVQAATGLDLDKDLLDWMGDFGVFVRGGSLPELDGALIIETKDEAASKRALDALARLAQTQAESGVEIGKLTAPGGGDGFTVRSADVPKPIHVFQRNGRVVAAYGDAAATDAVDAGEKLGDSAAFKGAGDSLGDGYDVSFYVLMEPIFDLVESTGAASDPDFQKAKPYLEPLDALVGGTSGDGDDLRTAFKLLVK